MVNKEIRKRRIAPIDGLRACAVLGVMWAHTWMFFGGLPLKVFHIDIHRLISFGGIGVDLFFVISGFCMYLMYAKGSVDFNAKTYGAFIFKRWRRIAPAFYFAVLIECTVIFLKSHFFPFDSFFGHLFFVNTFISDNVLSPSFWSLSTEWQFYIILPLLFIKDPVGDKRIFRILILMAICFVFRLWTYYQHSSEMHQGLTIQTDKIWYRFIEFGWGMLAAIIYTKKIPLPSYLKDTRGFIFSFLIALVGRLFMMTEVFNHFHFFAFLIRALGEPLLTLGFALIVLNVTGSKTIFSGGLSVSFMQFVGKISYSMYLWHWIIVWNICEWFIKHNLISPYYLNAAFTVSLIFLIPVAWISYRLFEAPYFKTSEKSGQHLNYTVVATTDSN